MLLSFIAAALSLTYHRNNFQAPRPRPTALFSVREIDIGMCPLPIILESIKGRRLQLILELKLWLSRIHW